MMLGKQKVTIECDDDGTTTVKVEGVKGVTCKTLTADLIRKLGGQVISSEPTREMKERVSNRQEVKN